MEKREKWEETKLITNQNRKGVKSSTKRHVQKTEDQPRLQLLIYLRKINKSTQCKSAATP